jgi:D-alanyl-lipoteichoic acid acyltransferase DltB (MBOAT superfamily)
MFTWPNIDYTKLSGLLEYNAKEPLLFNTGYFVWMFAAFMLVYGMVYRNTFTRTFYLTLFSLFFYYKSSGTIVFMLVGSTILDFLIGNRIEAAQTKGGKKGWLISSLLVNLGALVYFKYAGFILKNVGVDTETISNILNNGLEAINITGWVGYFNIDNMILPVGISFFTFQKLSYTIDIYRGQLKPTKSFLDFSFFVTFFPHLVAGPIVRAADFLPQIRVKTTITKAQFGRAVFLIATGLFKKAVISDYISTNFVDRVFDDPGLYTGFENLAAVYAYALQIYCDFSGYSDMAIGIAQLVGYTLKPNFNSPYKSADVTEFWRRWHMSLSFWLRDYVYISLGGNRKGKVMQYVNQMITMLIGGLWHGAAWQFILWGALHGLALGFDKAIRTVFDVRKNTFTKLAGIFFTFHFVCFCWIYFRAPSIDVAHQVMSRIAYAFHPEIWMGFIKGYPNVIVLVVLGYLMHFTPTRFKMGLQKVVTNTPLIGKVALILFIAYIVIQVKSAEIQPFIYFQF